MKRRNVIKSLLASLGIAGASVAAPVMVSASSVNDQAEGLDDLIEIQTRKACHDHNPYMVGLANGLILARSALFGGEVQFVELPKKERPFDQLTSEIQTDSDYAWAWHCVIATSARKEGVDYENAQRIAARAMSSIFHVDTSSRAERVNAYWKR